MLSPRLALGRGGGHPLLELKRGDLADRVVELHAKRRGHRGTDGRGLRVEESLHAPPRVEDRKVNGLHVPSSVKCDVDAKGRARPRRVLPRRAMGEANGRELEADGPHREADGGYVEPGGQDHETDRWYRGVDGRALQAAGFCRGAN